MRSLLVLLFAGTLAVHAQNPTPAQQAEQYYNQGIAAEKAGDPKAARTAYQQALKLNPRHANAQFRLGELKGESANIAAKGRAAKFGQVTIPQFGVEDATLSDAIETLRVAIGKAAPEGTESPNFIIKDPDGKLTKARITFQLKGVPAKAILDYIVSQAGAKVTYEEYAVAISPQS